MSIDNGFRNQFSFIDYRKWGVIELWAAGRISSAPPIRQRADTCIEVWFNWALVGQHKAYKDARRQLDELLRQAPVKLDEFLHYLDPE